MATMHDTETIAHIRKLPDGRYADPHLLSDHIRSVSTLASAFAGAFGNADWGSLAGLWHDLGKYKPQFQEYIRKSSGFECDESDEGGPGRIDHSIVGALHAVKTFGEGSPVARVLAYLIAGHHAGLPDWFNEKGVGGCVAGRLNEIHHLEHALKGNPPTEILSAAPPSTQPKVLNPEDIHLWIRMLYSCLVDADFLDTENYMELSRNEERKRNIPKLPELKLQFDAYMKELVSRAQDTPVNRVRNRVLAECRAGAAQNPGLFSLTVPTGGGKTLASMAFALDHAIGYGKTRIIVVIPYTSIIEQTAEQYRKVFGEEAVLEHHSNLDPDRETLHSKLASENWDAPIIITTNVQFFESLFSARTSSCRKLHRIVNSVVILDEAQILPTGYLQPVVSVLNSLSCCFGTTIVLCTATQPVLTGSIGSGEAILNGFPAGSVRELMSEPKRLSEDLVRVTVSIHPRRETPVTWEDLAKEISVQERVLCIVNSRKDCRDLFNLLPEGTVHLSALMCGEHRSDVIADIKEFLGRGLPVRVVSTQLVEAGVDIDFPVVYRALAGLDSIAQAAGRCNREGKLNERGALGRTIVFVPPRTAPPGILRKGADAGMEMIRCYPEAVERLDPDAYSKYFRLFYSKVSSFDVKNIMELLAGGDAVQKMKIQFRTAARDFRMIDDSGQSTIIVWYETAGKNGRERIDSESLISELENGGPRRALLRKLQRFTVTIPTRVLAELYREGWVRQIEGLDNVWVQSFKRLYDPVFGLTLEGLSHEPEDFIT